MNKHVTGPRFLQWKLSRLVFFSLGWTWLFCSHQEDKSFSPGILIACLSWLAQKQHHRAAVPLTQYPESNASHRGGCTGHVGESATFCCVSLADWGAAQQRPGRGEGQALFHPLPSQHSLHSSTYCLAGAGGGIEHLPSVLLHYCHYCQEWYLLHHPESSVYSPLKRKWQKKVHPVGFCPLPLLASPFSFVPSEYLDKFSLFDCLFVWGEVMFKANFCPHLSCCLAPTWDRYRRWRADGGLNSGDNSLRWRRRCPSLCWGVRPWHQWERKFQHILSWPSLSFHGNK